MSVEKFELWEGRKATFEQPGDLKETITGKFVQWGDADYWELVPNDPLHFGDEANAAYWENQFERDHLTFIDEYPDYERVDLPLDCEVLAGDILVRYNGEFHVTEKDVKSDVVYGIASALGYVWRPKGEK